MGTIDNKGAGAVGSFSGQELAQVAGAPGAGE